MTVTGIVYKIKGGAAYIRCARPQSCEHCENSGFCNKKETELRAYNPIDAEIGDTVEVETREDGRSMLVIAYIFLVPVAILFLSYFMYTIYKYLAFAAVIFIAAYLFGLNVLNKKYDPQVKITRIIGKKTEDSE